ncbi:ribonuclease H2 subunit B-like [Saccoglossus kowalevskii]|uniref:Ribonuclease H2 subunit B n=1 Tax=Saccoglossus kowalevskii TaxID=10224 RepID=A0ABM0GQ04_SACKO|nr:PREDICTED: ribonuclease H2 subunit B-like [Saccoglossus kowalevskii]
MPKIPKAKIKPPVEKDKSQWVLITPESSVSEVKPNDEEPCFVKLRHPKTEQGAMFMLTNNNTEILEVLRFDDQYRSWFIGETVQQDGSMFMSTAIDPLFLLLPYIVKADKSSMFMTLDQIVTDEDYPQCIKLLSCSGISDLCHITDSKGNEDFKAYRLNKDKLMEWLKLKTERLADCLEKHSIHAVGVKAETFVRSSKDNSVTRDDYLRFSHGMMSDYLSISLSKELNQFLDIKEKVVEKSSPEGPPAKKLRLSNGCEPDEDYTKFNSTESNTVKPAGKLTNAQKTLKKVDKSGMKNIASFFSPKPPTKKRKK